MLTFGEDFETVVKSKTHFPSKHVIYLPTSFFLWQPLLSEHFPFVVSVTLWHDIPTSIWGRSKCLKVLLPSV